MLSEVDKRDDQNRYVQRGQDRCEMHLRPGVRDREIRNAPVIPPPNDEDRLDDDACDGTRPAHLFRLAVGWRKIARVPIGGPFLEEMEFAQAKIEYGEQERDEKESGQRKMHHPKKNVSEFARGIDVRAQN